VQYENSSTDRFHSGRDGPETLRPVAVGSTWARGTYERLIETAIKRGLDKKTRRQLIGAARRGVATPFAMEKIEAVCSKLEPQEIDSELISLAGFMCIPFSSFFQQGEAT
jgi:hypothetical protein